MLSIVNSPGSLNQPILLPKNHISTLLKSIEEGKPGCAMLGLLQLLGLDRRAILAGVRILFLLGYELEKGLRAV